MRPSAQPTNVVTYSISDPRLVDLFGVGGPNHSGEPVNERTALTLSAVYRAGAVISGTIATLPLRTYRTTDNDVREQVASFLDNPAGPDRQTPFEWVETAVLHLLFGGDMFGLHITNGAGSVVGLSLVHPLCVGVEWDESYLGGKKFTVTHEDGRAESMGAEKMLHIPGPSLDGLRGMSVITQARTSFGTSLAGDKAAARMFRNGMIHQVLVSSDEDDLPDDEAKQIKEDLTSKVSGADNAGSINVINRRLKLTPFTMSAEDAQFIESREFQISEVARWFGVPATLLMKDGAVSTWGTGVEIMNAGLHRYTLATWTARIEQRLSRLLSSPRTAEFDYSGFLRPAPADEVNLLIQQVNSGLLTLNEARRVRNLPPLADPSADLPRTPPGAIPPTVPTAPAPEVQP